ncbi:MULTISPECIES: hypothetical protein [Enterobacter]|uniref:hypothetical protein n=1 Tax=Enterobacter TaxID=547 RepID=UPI000480D6D6|nr:MULTISPECIES: hypothetical protein [Enterobacter cloacae complex]HDT2077482.1 hypothetical protein [Enterobacter roggenkampii]HEG2000062.1 hypothetical protein [Enterobacter asburiae]MCD2460957.1 hypothetical protein [Enterobacter cloacae complex sp. 2021EL-01261]MDT9873532.1 hypothetical protein [Enterobacter cloacae]HDT2097897.1 hypothetical protein [Enterobacter roggenkampii]
MYNRANLTFLLVSLLSGMAHSDDDTKGTQWVFDKVSGNDLFGKHDTDVINHLNMIYSKSILSIEDKKLIITNDFLENKSVCSTDYVKLKRSAISYFMSTKTLNLYSALFKHENLQLPENVYEFTSLFPGKECPAPYDEIVKAGNNLFVTEQNYVLFYKHSDVITPQNNDSHSKSDWREYCHNENPNRQFDGTSKYTCKFNNLDVSSAYQMFIGFNKAVSDNLKNNLSSSNDSYKINDGSVVYKWINKNKLSISVVMDSETTNYSFDKISTGTKLDVVVDTQY